jgi:hypothetical protein
MKKLAGLVLGLVILASFSMTSCKKECTCKTSSNVEGYVSTTTTVETKEKCSDLNSSTTTGTYTVEMKCE